MAEQRAKRPRESDGGDDARDAARAHIDAHDDGDDAHDDNDDDDDNNDDDDSNDGVDVDFVGDDVRHGGRTHTSARNAALTAAAGARTPCSCCGAAA